MENVYIVAAKRTAITKAKIGKLANTRPDDMLATLIKDLLLITKTDPKTIDDVIIGCATPEAEQGLNIARISSLLAGLPYSVPGLTVNRFCASGLESIATAAAKIQAGQAESILAGGVESMSLLPFGGHNISANPTLFKPESDLDGVAYSMGLTAEQVARKYNIGRIEQDKFSLNSHRKAIVAIENNIFAPEITTIVNDKKIVDGSGIKVTTTEEKVLVDHGPRTDTSLEALSKLKTVFKQEGTVTAGNSSQVSDGAALVMLVSEKYLQENNLTPLGRFVSYHVAGVDPKFMGMGPVEAIPKALQKANLKIDDIGHIELNEAFAAQALAVIKQLDLDFSTINPYGGAIAMGHPLGATGAIKTTTLLHSMQRRKQRYGMVTMCVGTGMGAAGIFERT